MDKTEEQERFKKKVEDKPVVSFSLDAIFDGEKSKKIIELIEDLKKSNIKFELEE
ncbi:hypothetical protein KKC83_03680 [Patescibacteria group bacterium]|nr:hypothetical protein [Patescibacteria group bacterium]MBU4014711.1 hypothetical protein [Patescibacteria group bacterium]MBU4026614.1 hypothetical protein [Patescibacteria group bacterium]MBU4073513.1 hypothetical protein [Patescibacteria group bacterium]MBU4103107.1 hypothetical protein [Patescibacteria group bacterium]